MEVQVKRATDIFPGLKLVIVKNRKGRRIIGGGDVGTGRGSGEQRYAVIPPAKEGEDTCWGGDNPPAGYDTVADAINAFLEIQRSYGLKNSAHLFEAMRLKER